MNTNKLKLLLVGGLALAAQGLAAPEPVDLEGEARKSAAREPVIPLTDPPQDLRDENGNFELDLVDPFQRGSAKAVEEQESDGLSSTSLGEISEEFRILAIVIPEDESHQPMALIRLQNESSPQVVRKEDLVQIKRRAPDRRAPVQMRPSATNAAQGQPSFAESALNALESYSFYLHIKDIQPTFIEAYQKKSPNETIILRW